MERRPEVHRGRWYEHALDAVDQVRFGLPVGALIEPVALEQRRAYSHDGTPPAADTQNRSQTAGDAGAAGRSVDSAGQLSAPRAPRGDSGRPPLRGLRHR